MSNQSYITEMLELKDNNVIFKENCYYKEKINGITHKIFEGYLSYKPKFVLNMVFYLMINLKNTDLLFLISKYLKYQATKQFLDCINKDIFVSIVIKLLHYLRLLQIMVVLFLTILNIKSQKI